MAFRGMVDLPMGLGDHLHELRRRLMWPLISIGIVFVAAFAFEHQLKGVILWPLKRAIQLVGFETAHHVGLVQSTQQFAAIMDHGHEGKYLWVMGIAEATTTAVKISLAVGIVVALPVLLWHLWHFVAVGLTAKERRLVFFFLPLGVIFFYAGAIAGYFFGLPYFFAMLIDFSARMSNTAYQLRLSEYVDAFILWTVSFGLIMDIPWLVMVLVRTGMVTPDTISKHRRHVVAANLIAAACLTPTASLEAMVAMFIPMQLLFEAGLLVSRLLFRVRPVAPAP